MVRTVKSPQERREEIVSMSCQLFLKKGYENTTMKDVMEGLGIAKGTIYHYFKSKDELLESVIEHIARQRLSFHLELLEQTTGNGLERIEQFVNLTTRKDLEHLEIIHHLHQPANAGMHIRILARHITLQAPLYESLIRQGCEEGVFSVQHALEAAEFILSGIQFLTDIGISNWSEDQLSRRLLAFPSIVESLLNAQPGSFAFLIEAIQ